MGERATIDRRGRLCIPVQIRKELNLHEGDTVIVEPVNAGEFRVIRLANAVQKGRGIYGNLRKGGESVVSELIRDRRHEAQREDARSE
ncbi:MAG: AbrB/MazE/SpoVT family DNA-binding domain-containing protein [Limnochordales bacterium]|nr:AbrB/MazE/SpoVT family DNA-binding domain-containing protein [Limnochordales bacterium]